MSRSIHSATEYLGSPRLYRTNSSEKFSWTSEIGNRSLKTRSRPTSSRSCEAASSWSSDSKARVWMSSRWGISMPVSSFANEIWFIISLGAHPLAGRTESGDTGGAKRSVPDGASHFSVTSPPGEERYNDGTAVKTTIGRQPYLTSTVAPSASSLALIAAASSFVTFSFTAFGAPSTKSLASFRPRPVSSRTTLMT